MLVESVHVSVKGWPVTTRRQKGRTRTSTESRRLETVGTQKLKAGIDRCQSASAGTIDEAIAIAVAQRRREPHLSQRGKSVGTAEEKTPVSVYWRPQGSVSPFTPRRGGRLTI